MIYSLILSLFLSYIHTCCSHYHLYKTYNYELEPLSTASVNIYNPDINIDIIIEFDSFIYITIQYHNDTNNNTIKLNVLNDNEWNEVSTISVISSLLLNRRDLLSEIEEEGFISAIINGLTDNNGFRNRKRAHKKRLKDRALEALARIKREEGKVYNAMKEHDDEQLEILTKRIAAHKVKEREKQLKWRLKEQNQRIAHERKMMFQRNTFYRDLQHRSYRRRRRRDRRRRREKMKELHLRNYRRQIKWSNLLRDKQLKQQNSERTFRWLTEMGAFKKKKSNKFDCRPFRYRSDNNQYSQYYNSYSNRRMLMEEAEAEEEEEFVGIALNLAKAALWSVQAARRTAARLKRKIESAANELNIRIKWARKRKEWKKMRKRNKEMWKRRHKENIAKHGRERKRDQRRRNRITGMRTEWENGRKLYVSKARRYYAIRRRARRRSRELRRRRRRKMRLKEFYRHLRKQYEYDKQERNHQTKEKRYHSAVHLLKRLLNWRKTQRLKRIKYCRNKLDSMKKVRRRILDYNHVDIIDYLLKCKIVYVGSKYYEICIKYDMIDKYLIIDVKYIYDYIDKQKNEKIDVNDNLLEYLAWKNALITKSNDVDGSGSGTYYFNELEMIYNNIDMKVNYIECNDQLDELPFKICIKQFNNDTVLYFEAIDVTLDQDVEYNKLNEFINGSYNYNNDDEWDEINIIKSYTQDANNEHRQKCINHLSMAIICIEQFSIYHGKVSIRFRKV